MDNFIKNIKQKLSINELVDMMKQSEVINEDAIKEDDVRNTFANIDPDALLDVDEMAMKLNEISEDLNKSTYKTGNSEKILDIEEDCTKSQKLKEDRDSRVDAGKSTDIQSTISKKQNNWKLESDSLDEKVEGEAKANVRVIEKNEEPEKLPKNDSDYLPSLGRERNDFSLNDDFYYF